MNITQIKYVLEIANSSSMREAAVKLFVSQPALSASITSLEKELGITIFERTNKGIALTDEGREFVTYAKKAFDQYQILEERFLSKDSHKERFSVSAQHYIFAIRAFSRVIQRNNLDEYAFQIHETRTMEVLEDVKALKSEVGVVSFTDTGKDIFKKLFKEYQLDYKQLMIRDPYVYLWKDHKFADRDEVSLEELADYPCVVFDQDGDSEHYLMEEPMADFDFKKVINSEDRATSMELIADLQGYSIGCGMLQSEDVILKGMVAVKLKEEDHINIGYITRKGSSLSEYGKQYVEELLKYKEV